MTGLTLAQYRIDAELGRGGMGIVYRATDTKLDRAVALKVLPPHALSSEDDRARFYREAKAAAQLHHPRIATVFQIDEAVLVEEGRAPALDAEKRPFIAMEYVDGETLAERITKGPLKLEEAVRVATQAAEALGAAHEAGIVHRDVKSGNVMITLKGEIKMLDFGLAKTAASTQLTRQGATLGTVAYMSPEQARGEEVDARTDLWALGVVLYEMIAGRLPFQADYEQAALYGILNEDPEPLTAVRTGVPMGLEWIVSKLLAKRTDNRYRTAHDLLVDLRTVDLSQAGLSRISTTSQGIPSKRSGGRGPGRPSIRTIGLAGVAAVAVLALGFWIGSTRQTDTGPSYSMKRISHSVQIGRVVSSLDISPRGDRIAFSTDALRVLDLTTGQVNSYDLPSSAVYVSYSPSGNEILLTSAAGIDRISMPNGSVVHVHDTREGGPRADWVDENTILFEEDQSVFTMSLTSGALRQVIYKDTLAGEYDIDYPSMLPDGETVVATAQFRGQPDRIGFWDLETGDNRGYIDVPGTRVQWDAGGYLIFSADGDAMAMPFDLNGLRQTGPVFQLERGVRPEGLSVSAERTVVHVGERIGQQANSQPLVPMVLSFIDASASVELAFDAFPSAIYRDAVIHPDGHLAAVVIQQPGANRVDADSDIWILDFDNNTRRAVTRGGYSDSPAWNATGDSIYFVDKRNDHTLMVTAASGRGGADFVYSATTPAAWDLAVSRDGVWAAYAEGIPPAMDTQTRMVVWRVNSQFTTAGTGDPYKEEVETPNGNPRHFAFSPGGEYVAYEDQGAIFVQSLEDLDSAPYPVFENSMDTPRWAPDESRLYAIRADGSGVSVDIDLDPVFQVVGSPEVTTYYAVPGTMFDVFPDGKRFLLGYQGNTAASESATALPADTVAVHFILSPGPGG